MRDEMEGWGAYARNCPSKKLKYPSQSPFNRFRAQSNEDVKPIYISDDRAFQIDQAISKLYQKDEQIKTLLHDKFEYSCAFKEVGSRSEMSRDRAIRLIDNAMNQIFGYLAGRKDAA